MPSSRKETWPDNHTLFKQCDFYQYPQWITVVENILKAVSIVCFGWFPEPVATSVARPECFRASDSEASSMDAWGPGRTCTTRAAVSVGGRTLSDSERSSSGFQAVAATWSSPKSHWEAETDRKAISSTACAQGSEFLNGSDLSRLTIVCSIQILTVRTWLPVWCKIQDRGDQRLWWFGIDPFCTQSKQVNSLLAFSRFHKKIHTKS